MTDKTAVHNPDKKNIKVEVRLFATLREHFPHETRGVKEITIPYDSSIDNLIDIIGNIDKKTLILMVNGRRVKEFSGSLNGGDRVALFPPVGGG